MLKKFAVLSIGSLFFTNLLCSVIPTFDPESFEKLDVSNPKSLADVAHILNFQETLFKNDGLFNPKADKQIKGHSGHYLVNELSGEDKKTSVKNVLGSDDGADSKTVYAYQYSNYQAKENYPKVTGSFDGVKDSTSGELHLNGRVQIKLEGGNKILYFYLGSSSGTPNSVVIGRDSEARSGKISLSFGDGSQKDYDLSNVQEKDKALIKELGILNIK